MTVHKLRLFWLRNRLVILFAVVGFILITSLYTQIFLVQKALEQSRQNEDAIRGLSCISLIPQGERTLENVRICIDSNRSSDDDESFDFNQSPNENDQQPAAQNFTVDVIEVPAPPPSIVVKDVPKPSPPNHPTPPSQPEPVVPSVLREVEKRINPATDLLECRIVGTILWKVGDC